jgi:4-amino-4-deoxy-L-arabinose transferase-like glycosyltransferase
MLTYNKNYKLKRKDRPWLLFVLAIVWVLGTVFFHSAWEPYEPFVFAVVKGITYNNSWLVPYVSGAPYLEIQPFYFWVYAAVIKIFSITDISAIANTIRIINSLIILAVLAVLARVGSGLSVFKSGRTVILILISMFGFINISYKLSPNIFIVLGFGLLLYALQKHKDLPGISGWYLFLGLLLMSINFTCEFILIALILLIILPAIDKYWRSGRYCITLFIGIGLFLMIFYIYTVQLQQVSPEFFQDWQYRYGRLIYRSHYNFWLQTAETLKLLSWYVAPAWILTLWSIATKRRKIFQDKTLQVSVILIALLFIFTCISGDNVESCIFPSVILFALLAAAEVDSIRITIVSLSNSFSVIIFGLIGSLLWILYIALSMGTRYNDIVNYLLNLAQGYHYRFNLWQVLLALVISIIWLIMITRKHIRGREMVTNWAAGSTFVVVLFLTLWLPWFDSVLTFEPLIKNSIKYIKPDQCVATNKANSTQVALWYYYANISLIPTFVNLNYSICNQALIGTDNPKEIDARQWQIVWQAKRPIDKQVYYVVRRK